MSKNITYEYLKYFDIVKEFLSQGRYKIDAQNEKKETILMLCASIKTKWEGFLEDYDPKDYFYIYTSGCNS